MRGDLAKAGSRPVGGTALERQNPKGATCTRGAFGHITTAGLTAGYGPRSRGRRNRARMPILVLYAGQTASGARRRGDTVTPLQHSECFEGENPKSAVTLDKASLGFKGSKPSRGYPNPEGGPKAAWKTAGERGPLNLTCAEGSKKSTRGAGKRKRAG
jgi:hypothetical protein